MMINSIVKVGILVLGITALVSCNKTTQVSSFYTYQTECLGSELDGSQTLRVWGTGRNKADAVEQAMKNAVHEIIFKGIANGSPGCSVKPLLLEVNAAEKHEAYFSLFFRDKGTYKQYVTLQDEKKNSRIIESNKSIEKIGVVVRVLRTQLRSRLITDGIIKQ